MAVNPNASTALLSQARRKIGGDLTGRIRVAAADGVAGALNGVAALGEAFRVRLGNRNDIRTAHEQVAEAMRAAVLDAYELTVEARKTQESYRLQSRFATRLRPALQASSMAVASARGIDFVDAVRLYQEAKSFYRLNFGTQGPGFTVGGSRVVPVTLFGAQVMTLSLGVGPSPPFYLPKGLFLGGGSWRGAKIDRRGQDVFYPISELPTAGLVARAKRQERDHPAKAIEARQFLDAGLDALAYELPLAYDRLVQRWLAAGNEAAQAYLGNIKLRGGRVPQNLGAKSLRVTA